MNKSMMKMVFSGLILVCGMSFFSTTTYAADTGDIYAIVPGGSDPLNNITSPYVVGNTVEFSIRLLSKTLGNPNSYYTLQWNGVGDGAAMPLGIGVLVNGQPRRATVEIDETKNKGFGITELLCKYTVQAGDLAMPLLLAAKNGTVASNGVPYLLYNYGPTQWQIVDAVDSTKVVDFSFGRSTELANDGTEHNQNYDLSAGKIYIRTVDLDNNYVDAAATPKIWRKIPATKTDVTAKVALPVPSTSEPYTVYLWTGDKTVAAIVPNDGEQVLQGKYYDGTTEKFRDMTTLTIPTGAKEVAFKIKGIHEGGTTEVYMGTTLDENLLGGVLLTNFVSRTIEVVAPPDPTISFTLQGMETVTRSLTVDESDTVKHTATILLSEPFTKSVVVRPVVPPALVDKVKIEPTSQVIATGALSADFIVTALDGAADILLGAEFIDANATEATAFYTISEKATLRIRDVAPTFSFPNATLNVTQNQEVSIPVLVTDVAADMAETSDMTLNISSLFGGPTSSSVTLAPDKKTFKTTFTTDCLAETFVASITDKDGLQSANATFLLTVNVAPDMSVNIEFDKESYEEGESGKFRLVTSTKATKKTHFVINEVLGAPSNMWESSFKNRPNSVFIDINQTNSTWYVFRAKDGTVDTESGLLMLEPSIVTSGGTPDTTSTFVPGLGTLYIKNKKPTPDPMVLIAGSVKTASATKEYKPGFSMADIAGDVDADLAGLSARFVFQDGATTVAKSVDKTSIANLGYTYVAAGTNVVSIYVKDKDMGASEWVGPLQYTVIVSAEPSLTMVSSKEYFPENLYEPNDDYVRMQLNTPAPEDMTVKVKISPTPSNVNGLFSFWGTGVTRISDSEYSVLIKKGSSSIDLKVAQVRDGTMVSQTIGFTLEPEIENAVLDAFYSVQNAGNLFVQNSAPVIIAPADRSTNVTRIAMNTDLNLSWKVLDSSANDLADINTVGNNRITWLIGGTTYQFDNDAGVVLDAAGNPPTFTAAGNEIVQLTVTDKDGAVATRAFHYYVTASKIVVANPVGPYQTIPRAYANAGGLGAGTVRLDAAREEVVNFGHTAWYPEGAGAAAITARPYRLADPIDAQIDATGNSTIVGPRYDYSLPANSGFNTGNHFNSYFYRWVEDNKESAVAEEALRISPSQSTAVTLGVTLPAIEDGKVAVPTLRFSAVFSREWMVGDGCGDINADGIPDLVAARYALGNADGEDLANVSAVNEDQDFFPSRSNQGGTIVPGLQEAWVAAGRPFTAIMEVRGMHNGLNLRPGVYNGVTSTSNFSAAEEAAREAAWHAAGEHGTLAGFDWTPENPTDPTNPDTDGDGMPDGYEYYFWYYSHVGELVNGQLRKITGARYNPVDIGQGTTITPEEIAQAFNPTVYNDALGTGDIDGDGLSNMEEFTLGTNPINWDSDGDGMCDGWEVLRGLNPLVAQTDGSPEVSEQRNSDRDFMAYDQVDHFTVLTVMDGVTPVSYAVEDANAPVLVAAGDPKNYYQFTVNVGGNNEVFVSLDDPNPVTSGGVSYLPVALDAFTTFEYDDGAVHRYVGMPKQLAAGTYLVGLTPNVSMDGANLNATIELPRAFRYGNAQAPFALTLNNQELLVGRQVVGFLADQTVAVIHNTVYDRFEFDPRTAWSMNAGGVVADRWRGDEAGRSVRTVPYTATDEYLLLQYRLASGIVDVGAVTPTAARPLVTIWNALTTNPLDNGADIHGADTDGDSVPDGWELYVGTNPNNTNDVAADGDGDGLSIAREFAGTDSCAAYANTPSIAGNAPVVEGFPWLNKFFPTDPNEADTDGDGLSDGDEGARWQGETWEGRTRRSATLSFLYGPAVDDASKCIRGGGLNPCTVDTDQDLLPDAWEYQFAGAVTQTEGGIQYIDNGMDGTDGDDAYTLPFNSVNPVDPDTIDPRIGVHRDYDFDHDGLQNYQEYLVQAMRHLRYDDPPAPVGNPLNAGTPFDMLSLNAGYFVDPPRDWDRLMFNPEGAGLAVTPNFRVMLFPTGVTGQGMNAEANGYVSTDPRRWDSDDDGMDDFYELFHGLNPLYGMEDVIALKYGFPTATQNAHNVLGADYDLSMNYVNYPWLAGHQDADPDGDGLRNRDEAIGPDQVSPMPMNTDPTPLWMTDPSYALSLTAQYYHREIGDSADLGLYWSWSLEDSVHSMDGVDETAIFSFEQNEGFDTDGDGISDAKEIIRDVTPASDAQRFDDPSRRQALYLTGANSLALSYTPTHRVYQNEGLLRQFTVEAWICPDRVTGAEQVIVERVASYPGSHGDNSTEVDPTIEKFYNRANFRIGITTDGRVFGMFDNSDARESGSNATRSCHRVTSSHVIGANAWTHVALLFDGKELTLMINGVINCVEPTSLIPANGIGSILQDVTSVDYPAGNYEAYLSAVVIGAQTLTEAGLDLATADFANNDYDHFYQGFVDEVRVWDGARTPVAVAADYQKRYSIDDLTTFRMDLYTAWIDGASRNNNDATANGVLPPELLMHYNFDTLFGGVSASSVALLPTGYQTALGSPNLTPPAFVCGWWSASQVRSTVYTQYGYVPWIKNMAAHLPMLDGSVWNSMYWSSAFAGTDAATQRGATKYNFPNTANPYTLRAYDVSTAYHYQRYVEMSMGTGENVNAATEARRRFRFDSQSRFKEATDLLPLGGAYAKVALTMWDNAGAAAQWPNSGVDTNDDGLPDWWMAYATATYGFSASVAPESLVDYKGTKVPVRDVYLRDLAAGVVPNAAGTSGVLNAAYAQTMDENGNDIPDWWDNLYQLKDGTLIADTDGDGLSNYTEYMISEIFKPADDRFPLLNPIVSNTTGNGVLDYFLRVGKLYLGEMFTDHDFMEDEWEDKYSKSFVSRYLYDSHGDADGDGWSNFAECRFSNMMQSLDAENEARAAFVDAILEDEDLLFRNVPTPTLKVSLNYEGPQAIRGVPLVLQTYTDAGKVIPDATFNIVPGAEPATISRFLGPWQEGRHFRGTLSPGHIIPASVSVQALDYQQSNFYTWYTPRSNEYKTGTFAEYYDARLWDPTITLVETVLAWVTLGELECYPANGMESQGYFTYRGARVGTMNFETGEYDLDVSKLEGTQMIPFELSQGMFRMTYTYSIPTLTPDKQNYYLTIPDTGLVKEGKTMITAFADLDGNGLYTAGEPFGIAKDVLVDVSWHSAKAEIVLTDTNPVFARINLVDGTSDRAAIAGSANSDIGLNPESLGTVGEGKQVRVRVLRYAVNGVGTAKTSSTPIPAAVVVDKMLPFGIARNFLHEGDFLSDTSFDIDWTTLDADMAPLKSRYGQLSIITNVMYQVFFGDGDVTTVSTASNAYYQVISRVFDGTHMAPSCVSPLNSVIYSSSPTFTWSMKDTSGFVHNTYTAFKLQIQSSTDGSVIYDSGVQHAPMQDKNGNYTWTAPVYVNTQTPQGKIFANTNNYTWRVTMLNAAWRDDKWSTTSGNSFRMDVSMKAGGMGGIDATVKYMGPGIVDASMTTLTNKVRVQAFTTPDFTGSPATEMVVTNIVALTDATNMTVNAKLRGIPAGTYYVRAYLDVNCNFKREAWESWGYDNYRNDNRAKESAFTPRGIVVVQESLVPATSTVYMEDCDTDQDWLPDVWEMQTGGSITVKGPATGSNGTTEVNPDLQLSVNNNVASSFLALASLESPDMASLVLGLDVSDDDTSAAAVRRYLAGSSTVRSVNITGITSNTIDWTTEVETTPPANTQSLYSIRTTRVAAVSESMVVVKYTVYYAPTLTTPLDQWTIVKEETVQLAPGGVQSKTAELNAAFERDARQGFYRMTVEVQ